MNISQWGMFPGWLGRFKDGRLEWFPMSWDRWLVEYYGPGTEPTWCCFEKSGEQ